MNAAANVVLQHMLDGTMTRSEGVNRLLELAHRSQLPYRIVSGVGTRDTHQTQDLTSAIYEKLATRLDDPQFFRPEKLSGITTYSGYLHKTLPPMVRSSRRDMNRANDKLVPFDPTIEHDNALDGGANNLGMSWADEEAQRHVPWDALPRPFLDDPDRMALAMDIFRQRPREHKMHSFAHAAALITAYNLTTPIRPASRTVRRRLHTNLLADPKLAMRSVAYAAQVKNKLTSHSSDEHDPDLLDMWESFNPDQLFTVAEHTEPEIASRLLLSAVEDFPRPNRETVSRFKAHAGEIVHARGYSWKLARAIVSSFFSYEYAVTAARDRSSDIAERAKLADESARRFERFRALHPELHPLLLMVAHEMLGDPYNITVDTNCEAIVQARKAS